MVKTYTDKQTDRQADTVESRSIMKRTQRYTHLKSKKKKEKKRD